MWCLTAFHQACYHGYLQVAKLLIQKSAQFNIELNARDNEGFTAFHLACMEGRTSTVEIMMNNAKSFKLDLTAIDKGNRTGFQLAEHFRKKDVVNLIKRKMPSIAVYN